jgi:tetratricopeptide (TPR) repeat protein
MEHKPPNVGPDLAMRQLARAFACEPELIAACLQGTLPEEQSTPARTVLGAAQLALRSRPDYADLHYHAGQAAIAACEYEAAAELLDGALRLNPDYQDALILAAHVALLRRQHGSAKKLLLNALAKGADYPDVHLRLGDACRAEGDWGQARAAYERALTLNANLSAARTALAALPATETSGKNDELSA